MAARTPQGSKFMRPTILCEDLMRPDPNQSFTFVIPSVRGDTKKLHEAVDMVEMYPLSKSDRVVFLGDNLRGDTNISIMAMLAAYKGLKPTMSFFLHGPSEHKLMTMNRAFMSSSDGQNMVKSYRRDKLNLDTLLRDRIWLRQLNYAYKSDKYFISHGGVAMTKGISLDKYPKNLLVYGREAFKESNTLFDKLVVYSEEEGTKTKFRKGRIGLDSNSILVLDNMAHEPTVKELLTIG